MTHLTEKDLAEFKALYLARFDIDLSDELAREKATWLIDFVRFLCRLDGGGPS